MRFTARISLGFSMALLATSPNMVAAQTDYFNTDRGRPLRVQDAMAIERYAFELQAAPLTWERASGGNALWSVEPELAYGILPRTQVEVGIPLYLAEEGTGRRGGVGAVHVSLLHALNVETLGMPAIAMSAAAAIPAGSLGPRQAYGTLGVLTTRTMGFGRIHLNADATVGPDPEDADSRPGLDDLTRWSAGVAVDRTFPLRSLLIGAEVVAGQPIHSDSDVQWRAGAGVRWQASPQWAFDAGLGRTLDDTREWTITIGAARAFAILKFFPVAR